MQGKPYDPLPIGVLVLDAHLRIRVWNRWLSEHTGIPDSRAISQRLEDLFPGFRNPRFQIAIEQVMRNAGPQILSQALHRYLIPIDLPHLARHGFGLMRQHVHIEAHDFDGERLALVSIIDVTGSVLRTEALSDVAQRLEHDVNRDPLTGLFNRRFMWEWLEHQLRQAQRHNYPVAAMMLDVDHFKAINDHHGHPVGDRVLQDLARHLSSWVRESDIVVRFGGEEFLILLPCCDQGLSRDVAERIVRQTRQCGLGGLPVGAVTCSIGVSLFDAGQTLAAPDLINLADSRLYLAKQAGRDRAVTTG